MLQIQAIVLIAILFIYILTAHVISIKRIKYLHESVVAIFLGIMIALILKYTMEQNVKFNPELFFGLLLPAIIFAAGYNLHRDHFFDNFWLIFYHGIICTIITFIILSVAALLFKDWGLVDFGEDEILLLTATLCATDTVAALTLVKEKEYPRLNSVLFGEGIFNDAVSILLFRSVKEYMTANTSFSQISLSISFIIFIDFVYLMIMSLFIGIIFGTISGLMFKYIDSLGKHPVKETSLILLLGYASYLSAEALHLSGILSLFCCGVILAIYTYPNLSKDAQSGTKLAFDSVGYLAEAFVFAYLGITTLEIPFDSIPWAFSILMMIVMAFARFVTIFFLPCIFLIFRKPFQLNFKELQVIWYSGLIRGVIAFALSVTIQTKNSLQLQGCVLFIVLATTCVGSILLESFSQCIGLKIEDSDFASFSEFMLDKSTEQSSYQSIGPQIIEPPKEVVPKTIWQRLEQNIVRPLFSKKVPQQEPAEIGLYAISK